VADDIGNLRVKVSLDNTGFQDGISNLNRQMRVVQSEFKVAAARLGDFGKSEDGLKSKTDLLNKQIDIQKQRVSTLAGAFQKSATEKGRDAKATQELEIKLNKAKASLHTMENELKQTNTQLENYRKRADGAEKATSSLGNRMKTDLGRSIDDARKRNDNLFEGVAAGSRAMGVGLTAAGVGIAAGLGSAVNTTVDFDTQMGRVRAKAGATKEEFEKLRAQAIQLGAETTYSASQSAGAMDMLAAAGMNSQQIMAAMPGVLSAAAASGEDMSLVAETMGSVLNAFNLEAGKSGHVADVLAEASNRSAVGVQDIAYSMKYAAPVAAQLGVKVEEVGAALIEMGNAGIKGEQAGTTLRSALLNLVDPPKEAQKALSSLGVQIKDSQGNMRPLGDIIGSLKNSMEGMTQAEKAQALSMIFGKEAVSGMMVLISQGPEKFKEFTKALENSDGAAKKAADIMKDNLGGALEEMGGSLESAKISFGDALTPTIRIVSEAITGIINAFNSLPGPVKSTIAVVAVAVAGIALIAGPLLMLVGFIPSIAAGFSMLAPILTAVAGGFTAVWAAITGPIGIVIAVIAAVAAGVYLIYKNWDSIAAFFSKLWQSVKDIFSAAWASITGFLSKALQGIIELFKTYHPLGIIISHWSEIKAYFGNLAGEALQWGANIVRGIIDGITGFIGRAVDAARNLATSIKNTVKSVLGISSPSRLMYEYGENVGAGLASGMDSGASQVRASSENLAGAVSAGMGKLREYDRVSTSVTGVAASFGSLRAVEAGYHKDTQAGMIKSAEGAKRWSSAIDGVGSSAKKAKDSLTELTDKALSKLDQALSITEKEFKLLEMTMGKAATTLDKMGLKKESMGIQFQLLTKEIGVLEGAYNKLAASKGKNSEDALKVYERLLDTKIRALDIQEELDKTTQSENRMRRNIALLEQGAMVAGASGMGMVVGGSNQSTTNITVNNYGTKAESADKATARSLQKLVYLGAFGQ
jgi:TP901 family phage tail tape measure protein